jgi:hypothetical protein
MAWYHLCVLHLLFNQGCLHLLAPNLSPLWQKCSPNPAISGLCFLLCSHIGLTFGTVGFFKILEP